MTTFEFPSRKELSNQLQEIRNNGLFDLLKKAAEENQIPLEWVLAIGSRETNLRNISGDHGFGRGILQIDIRSHAVVTVDFEKHPYVLISYGCQLLATNLKWAKTKWPKYVSEQHFKLASSAYNCGKGAVVHALSNGARDCDAHTAHKNYGADVLARKAVFSALLIEQKLK